MINPADLVATNAEAGASTLTVEATGGPVALSVAPALDVAEPITLARAKAHLRVVDPDEDDYISSLIVTAREMAEGRLNRTIVQRRRVARYNGWGVLKLRKPPLISVDSVEYVGTDKIPVTLDTGAYYVDQGNEDDIPRVALFWGGLYPALALQYNPITVSYTAGYPVGGVPQPIIQWMLLAIATMYDNRESVVTGTTSIALADDFAKWLLQTYMVYE